MNGDAMGLAVDGSGTVVIVNANVVTLNIDRPRAEAVAIEGKTITAVGSNAELSSLISPETKVIDGH